MTSVRRAAPAKSGCFRPKRYATNGVGMRHCTETRWERFSAHAGRLHARLQLSVSEDNALTSAPGPDAQSLHSGGRFGVYQTSPRHAAHPERALTRPCSDARRHDRLRRAAGPRDLPFPPARSAPSRHWHGAEQTVAQSEGRVCSWPGGRMCIAVIPDPCESASMILYGGIEIPRAKNVGSFREGACPRVFPGGRKSV
jgi:hypothetical protein